MTTRRLPQFPPHGGFYAALRAAVDEEIAAMDRTRDLVVTYTKIAVIGICTVACYAAYLSLSGGIVIFLAVPFGILLALVGFNVQHDGGHESLSRFRFINRCAAFSLDLLGGSSYVWRWKHNLYHHSYPNVGGVNSDIAIAPVGHFAPFHTRYWVHRYQHIYLWLLYGLLPVKWHFINDFRDVLRGQIGDMPLPRPRGLDLLLFLDRQGGVLCDRIRHTVARAWHHARADVLPCDVAGRRHRLECRIPTRTLRRGDGVLPGRSRG